MEKLVPWNALARLLCLPGGERRSSDQCLCSLGPILLQHFCWLFFFFSARDDYFLSLLHTILYLWLSGCQSETVRRRFCHDRGETSGNGAERSGFIGFNFLLFCNVNRSSRNVNVDAGCRGTLQTPGDVACEAQSDFSYCTLVALSSTKPQKSLNCWSKKRILKGCIDIKFDFFPFPSYFFFQWPSIQ